MPLPTAAPPDTLPRVAPPAPRQVACPGCQTRISSHGRCAHCGQCPDCCACQTGERPFVNGGDLTFWGDPSGAFPRHVGVEVECGLRRFAGPLLTVARAWHAQVKPDGSVGYSMRRSTAPAPPAGTGGLVAHSTGVEVASPPIAGEAADAFFLTLGEALRFHRAHADASCGLHVHVNMRGATWDDLARVARLWVKVEGALWNAVAPSRRRVRAINHYCAATGARLERAGVVTAQTTQDKVSALAAAHNGDRYFALNLTVFQSRGTVEIRMHHGTVNPVKIRQWAASMSQLVNWAVTRSDAQVDGLRGTPSEILTMVLQPEQAAWQAQRREHFAAIRSRIHPGQAPNRRRGSNAPPPTPAPAPQPREGGEV